MPGDIEAQLALEKAVRELQALEREALRSGSPRRQKPLGGVSTRSLRQSRSSASSRPPASYVLRSPTAVKVGISRDPVQRAAAINAAGPDPVELVEAWPTPSRRVALDVEARVLAALGAYRLNGEWLDCSVDEVVETVQAEVIRASNDDGRARSRT